MVNIGKKLEKMLVNVGINSPDELIKIGSVEATKLLKVEGVACYNKLYALEGAILGVRWHGIPKKHKQILKEEYDKTL